MNIELSTWLDWDPPADSEDPGIDDHDAGSDWRKMLAERRDERRVQGLDSHGDYCRPAAADLRPTLDPFGIPY